MTGAVDSPRPRLMPNPAWTAEYLRISVAPGRKSNLIHSLRQSWKWHSSAPGRNGPLQVGPAQLPWPLRESNLILMSSPAKSLLEVNLPTRWVRCHLHAMTIAWLGKKNDTVFYPLEIKRGDVVMIIAKRMSLATVCFAACYFTIVQAIHWPLAPARRQAFVDPEHKGTSPFSAAHSLSFIPNTI